MKKYILAIALTSVASVAIAQIDGTRPQGGGPIKMMSTEGPISLIEVQFTATGSYLSSGSNPAPSFAFVDAGPNQSGLTEVRLAGPLPFTFDGEATLDVLVSPEARTVDITAEFLRIEGMVDVVEVYR